MDGNAQSPHAAETSSPEAVWLRLTDGVVAGLHHALNNRAGALSAVAQVLAAELEAEHPLQRALLMEVERLQSTVALLDALPRGRERAPHPVQPADLTRRVVELFRIHHDLRDLACTVEDAPDVPPILVDPERLQQAMLVLLAAAGRAARRIGGGVRLRYSGGPDHVIFAVEASGGEGGGEGEEGLAGIDARAMEEWIRAEGGELRVREHDEGAVSYLVRLPTLLAVRRSRADASTG